MSALRTLRRLGGVERVEADTRQGVTVVTAHVHESGDELRPLAWYAETWGLALGWLRGQARIGSLPTVGGGRSGTYARRSDVVALVDRAPAARRDATDEADPVATLAAQLRKGA